jgi:DNA-binding NarL/FixJ family response regulator
MELSTTPIRIILLDEQLLFRAGLRLLLEGQADFKVVGETGNTADVMDLVIRQKPDIILFETNLTGKASIEMIPILIKRTESAKVLLLTGSCDPQLHLLAIQEGAVGIIQKNQPPELLFKAIRKVHQGEVWIERAMIANLLNRFTNPRHRNKQDLETEKFNLLSRREREVLSLIGEGYKNRDIAGRLSISETTVSHHLTSIFTKLGVSDRLELVIYSYRLGVVKPPAFTST